MEMPSCCCYFINLLVLQHCCYYINFKLASITTLVQDKHSVGGSVAADGPVRYGPGQCSQGGCGAGGVVPWGAVLAEHQWSVYLWSHLVFYESS